MALRSHFDASRLVSPAGITGREAPADLLEGAFPAYAGRQVRTAFQLMRRCAEGQTAVFATLSGAMTPAGLHASSIVPLIQRGYLDCLTTTGANLYHDAHRVIGHCLREIDPAAGDVALRQERIIRIYDLGFDEDALLDTDRLFCRLLLEPDLQRTMTTPEMNWLLGKQLFALEQQLGATQPCLLSACHQADVPIFVGAPQDGSIFLNAVMLRAALGDAFRFALDVNTDVYSMAALQWLVQREGETGIWILGGGVPKNYTLQGEPLLSQILGLDARGFDLDLQICVEVVDNGALSPCPAGEGHTWGKVSAECVQTSSAYLRSDVTVILPWLVHALLQACPPRPLKRLFRRLPEAKAHLDAAIAQRRAVLLSDLPTT
jgi:deoxyhypusine synthase